MQQQTGPLRQAVKFLSLWVFKTHTDKSMFDLLCVGNRTASAWRLGCRPPDTLSNHHICSKNGGLKIPIAVTNLDHCVARQEN